MKVTYLGIRSAHERVWLVEWKPIWLPRAYLTRGNLEPARGNLHVCKLLRDLTIIQIRTVTAEWVIFCSECICPTNVLHRKEREGRKEGRKEGRRGPEGEREKEGRNSYWERGRKRDTNNRVLSWINYKNQFPVAFYARSWQQKFKQPEWYCYCSLRNMSRLYRNLMVGLDKV